MRSVRRSAIKRKLYSRVHFTERLWRKEGETHACSTHMLKALLCSGSYWSLAPSCYTNAYLPHLKKKKNTEFNSILGVFLPVLEAIFDHPENSFGPLLCPKDPAWRSSTNKKALQAIDANRESIPCNESQGRQWQVPPPQKSKFVSKCRLIKKICKDHPCMFRFSAGNKSMVTSTDILCGIPSSVWQKGKFIVP